MPRFLRACFLALCLLCAGCQLADFTVARRSAIDAQITAARAEATAKMQTLSAQQVTLLQQTIAELNAQKQAAANYLFLGQATFSTLRTPTRPEFVMGHSIEQTAAQLPPAAPDVQAATFKQLQTDLDEAKTTNAQLQARYDTDLTAAKAEAAQKTTALSTIDAQLKQNEQDKQKVLAEAAKKEADLSDARKKLDDTTIAGQAKDLAAAKSVQALKTKLSAIVGGLGLILVLAAIYVPVFKQQTGIAAAVFLLAAVAIWYVQAWMLGVAVGVVVLILLGWMVKNHYIESKTASNVYNALNEVKTTAKADYDKVVAPALASWQTTYDKAGNPVPDHAAIAHVDSVLMASGTK